MLFNAEQLAAFGQGLQHDAEVGAAAARKTGGFIPRLDFDRVNPILVRCFTNKVLSPRLFIHEARNGDALLWTGVCMGNWVGAPPCAGCQAGIKGRWFVIVFAYEYGADKITVPGKNNQSYPDSLLKRFPRSVTQVNGFYSFDDQHGALDIDVHIRKIGQGTKSQYEYLPVMVNAQVQIPGYDGMQVMPVPHKTPFMLPQEVTDERVLKLMKARSEYDLMTIYDMALQAENYCKDQLGPDGKPINPDWRMPPTHLAELIVRKMIACPPGLEMPNQAGPKHVPQGAVQAPANRPQHTQPAPAQAIYQGTPPPQGAAMYGAQMYQQPAPPPQPAQAPVYQQSPPPPAPAAPLQSLGPAHYDPVAASQGQNPWSYPNAAGAAGGPAQGAAPGAAIGHPAGGGQTMTAPASAAGSPPSGFMPPPPGAATAPQQAPPNYTSAAGAGPNPQDQPGVFYATGYAPAVAQPGSTTTSGASYPATPNVGIPPNSPPGGYQAQPGNYGGME